MDMRVKAAWVSVASNTILVTFKLIIGLMIGSVSVIAEGIHSANDLLASFIALFAVKKSSQPPDEQHPYGHGKMENVSGTIEALLIFVAALWIIWEAADKLQRGGEMLPVGWGILIMGTSTVINLIISTYLFKVARASSSIALEADAMHLRTDVLTSLGVTVALIIIHFTKITLVDPIAAILVALLIIKAAWDLTKEAFHPLLDTAMCSQDLDVVKAILEEYGDDYLDYHDLRSRQAGRDSYLDLHLVTCPNMSVKQVHDLCDAIEDQITASLPYSQVLIHVEPGEEVSCDHKLQPQD
ncbi:MAG: cation diffusion facilitator family transporter [Methylocystaceae bacterium]